MALYSFSLLPQALLNYRLKSADGLSELYLFAFFNGYLAETFYIFFLNLPLAYKVLGPLGTLCISVIVCQRFYYATWNKKTIRLGKIYLVNVALICCSLPWMFMHPILAGNITGWMASVIWCTYQFPQVVKIFLKRSTSGFSFTLATMCGVASVLELSVAGALGLPIQTVVNAIRGIMVYLIFLFQFLIYRH